MLLSAVREPRTARSTWPARSPLTRAGGAAGLVVLAGGLATGCGSSTHAATAAGAATAKASSRAGQKAAAVPDALRLTSPQPAGKMVMVNTVTFEPIGAGAASPSGTSVGYLSVARDLAGHPGATLGYVRVKGGTSHNVPVPVSATLTSGTYWVLLSEGSTPPGATAPAHPDVQQKVTIS